ncbi:MAG: alkaline phosphatase [Planctomycetia bacterium]|nr:alkaline phosphatase [Planctomycetia bacterium]
MFFRRCRIIAVFLVLLILPVLGIAKEAEPVKYIFLFIGDGFSIPQRMMAEEYLHKKGEPGLYLNTLPNQVLTTTRSADSFITDSAASGTAIACGEKTKSGQLGVDVSGNRRLESVAEVARDAGRKVGIITSVTLNHATPAAFYGHNVSRGNGYALGLDLIESGFDYFAGGGIDKQDDQKNKLYKGDIYKLAPEHGYTVLHDPAAIENLKPGSGKIIACLKKGALPYAIDHEEGLRLVDYTKKGIELLDNPKGFFIMVEGGKIDWMCHANDAATVLREIFEFDQAVQAARDFMNAHPDDTLIAVTGDHETGGLTLGFAGTGYKSYIERLEYQKCSLDAFKVKLTALQNEKKNSFSFDDVKELTSKYFGLDFAEKSQSPLAVSKEENEILRGAFEKSFKGKKTSATPYALGVLRVFDNKAGLGWTSTAHTALPVDTSAVGKNADVFNGMIDNTDIAKKLKPMVR